MRHTAPAYSLVFAFLVMTVILIIATTTVENTNEKLVYFREMEGATQAQLSAESAAEQAILAMKDYSAGYSIELTEEVFQVDNNEDGAYESWGNYTVSSSAQMNSTDPRDYFYTPIPGTGTAGDPHGCSILNEDKDIDHPCNWNKLLYGESVTIPLYTDDGSGNILTPADFDDFAAWSLKIRTPCMDGSLDDPDCVRYTFDEVDSDPGKTIDGGDPVVFWQLVGEDSDGNSVSLLPDDGKGLYFGSYTRTSSNTEIYESLVNDAYDSSGDFIVLQAYNAAPYTDLYSVCMEDLNTLALQLNIVTPLLDESTGSFPYLEWQLEVESSQAFANTQAIVTGEGYYQAHDKIFYSPFVLTRSTTGEHTGLYTLSN